MKMFIAIIFGLLVGGLTSQTLTYKACEADDFKGQTCKTSKIIKSKVEKNGNK